VDTPATAALAKVVKNATIRVQERECLQLRKGKGRLWEGGGETDKKRVGGKDRGQSTYVVVVGLEIIEHEERAVQSRMF
jgi:hypothetical protein